MLESTIVSFWLTPYPVNPMKQSILPAGFSTQQLSRTTFLHRSHRLHGSHSHQGIYHCQVSTLHQSQGRKRRNRQRWDLSQRRPKNPTAQLNYSWHNNAGHWHFYCSSRAPLTAEQRSSLSFEALPIFTSSILQRSPEASCESAETLTRVLSKQTHTSADVGELWTHVCTIIKSLKRQWACTMITRVFPDCHSSAALPLFAFSPARVSLLHSEMLLYDSCVRDCRIKRGVVTRSPGSTTKNSILWKKQVFHILSAFSVYECVFVHLDILTTDIVFFPHTQTTIKQKYVCLHIFSIPLAFVSNRHFPILERPLLCYL